MVNSVLLADDHALVRAGIRALIEGFGGFEVVAECGDGREALRLTRLHHPGIVVMDLSMPGLNGLDATARIAKDFPHTRVVVLSMHTAENYVLEVLRAGALGFVVKDAAVEELESALKSVARGERYLSPVISRMVLEDYMRRLRGQGGAEAGEPEALTPRQREILQLIAEGVSTREIARRLSLSIKTVESHRAQIQRRLNIHEVAGLTRYAIRIGLVGPDV
ncbi:MAG: response regulator transcription factor [Betaproteobacteria bacterium]|nr:response regulator transcription factor [Betaproteobacteria bacterium]